MGVVERARRHGRDFFCRKLLIDAAGPADRTVLLSGSGRSGTTWIADMINWDNSHRVIFEPFHPENVAAAVSFGWRRYLRPDEQHADCAQAIQKILSGRVRSEWTERENRRFYSRKRLVKAIRANMMLCWIARHYPAMRIVQTIRHPCAVGDSVIRAGWPVNLDAYLGQPQLIEDHLGPYLSRVPELKSPMEIYVFGWCIEHRVMLKQFGEKPPFIVFYEELCMKTDEEFRRLFEYLRLAVPPRLGELLRRPSSMTASTSRAAIESGEDMALRWKKSLDADMIKRAQEIMSWFGLAGLYDADGMPGKAAIG